MEGYVYNFYAKKIQKQSLKFFSEKAIYGLPVTIIPKLWKIPNI